MPSTTSSWVSMVFDSSTVMTPSLPTFFMASAMILPMVSSLLAEMVPTWAIISPVTGFHAQAAAGAIFRRYLQRVHLVLVIFPLGRCALEGCRSGLGIVALVDLGA